MHHFTLKIALFRTCHTKKHITSHAFTTIAFPSFLWSFCCIICIAPRKCQNILYFQWGRIYITYNLLIYTSTYGPVGKSLIWWWELCHVMLLKPRVQFSLMPLFCICQISHGHVIYFLTRKVGSCLTWCIIAVDSYVCRYHMYMNLAYMAELWGGNTNPLHH